MRFRIRPVYRPLGRVTAVVLLCWVSPLPGSGQLPGDHGQHHHHGEAAPRAADAAVEAEDLRQIPDVRLLDQDGEEVRFYRDLIAGKVVAINFIFTTCTTVCPPMGAIFGKLQRDLGERVGRDVQLISVSVDPVTDTPERLRAWRQRFGTGRGWTLVTGDKAEVDRLLKSLEVFTPDFADHSPTVLVGNARTGSWKRAYGIAPAATISQLIEEMERDGGAEVAAP